MERIGKSGGGSFQAIQEYFRRQKCKSCQLNFVPEGIRLLREEPGILVVRITCLSCGSPLGVAIVGTGTSKEGSPSGFENSFSSAPRADWTKKDLKKFAELPPITYDDVLSAHFFFSEMGADWGKHLPTVKIRSAKAR